MQYLWNGIPSQTYFHRITSIRWRSQNIQCTQHSGQHLNEIQSTTL